MSQNKNIIKYKPGKVALFQLDELEIFYFSSKKNTNSRICSLLINSCSIYCELWWEHSHSKPYQI